MSASVTEHSEFVVGGTPRIVIRNRAGGLRIQRGADGQVHVAVTKRARDGFLGGTASQADLERIEVSVAQNGETIRIDTQIDREISLGKQFIVEIEVTAPASADLDLHLNAGNAEVRDITGAIEGVLNAGDFDVAGVTFAGRSSLTVNAGNLTVKGALAQGAALDAEVNAGTMRLFLPHDTPAFLDARTDIGSIDVDGWPVNFSRQIVRQKATGRLGPEPQGTVRLRVNTGSITLRAI